MYPPRRCVRRRNRRGHPVRCARRRAHPCGPLCSFDALLKKYRLQDPALQRLAGIIRAADTDTLDRSAEAPGLLAITLGLGANIRDDQALLRAGLVIYDALYTWCRTLAGERHGWYPETILKEIHP